jgi:hypothetical protein
MRGNHSKRMTTAHPAREDAAPMFWQADTGLDGRDTRASLGFASDGSECSGITGIGVEVDSIPSRSGGQDAVTYM